MGAGGETHYTGFGKGWLSFAGTRAILAGEIPR